MKTLLYDVESLPNVGLTWGTWDQKVIRVLHRRMVCSIAWQWYPKRERHVLALPDMPGYDPEKRNNKALMTAFAAELGAADIAIGHNINEFDDPMVNADLLLNGIKPPPPHKTVDTLKVCRARFRLNSNKLDDVCRELGIGKKIEHPGIDMWIGCMNGDPKSWAQMKKYNAHDVDPLLRGLYEHIRPWVPSHPNVNLTTNKKGCPSCGHMVLSSDGWRHTQAMSYIRMICVSCRSRCRKVMVGTKGDFVYRP